MRSTRTLLICLLAGVPLRADYPSTVLSTTPVAYFRLEAANDFSLANFFASTFSGGATLLQGGAITCASSNHSVALNGTNGMVTTALSGNVVEVGAIVAWVNLAQLPSQAGRIFYVAGESQNGNDFDLQFTTDNWVRFYVSNNGANVGYQPSASSLVNQWHMIAATFNANTNTELLYWDGNQVASANNAAKTGKSAQFNIGESTVFPGRWFAGDIDEVAVWNLALTAAQIKTIYDAANCQPPPANLTVTDVSPDMAYGTQQNFRCSNCTPNDSQTTAGSGTGGSGSGGRIHSLAADPINSNVVYAVTTGAGVWKSTDGAQSWAQASVGLKNGLALSSNTVLALDGNNPKRLLYSTNHDDGSPGDGGSYGYGNGKGPAGTSPYWLYGGLYVSTDSAVTWQHAEGSSGKGGLCPGSDSDILSASFVSGQPLVATPCGLFTNATANLANGSAWQTINTLPAGLSTSGAILAPNSWGNVIFICNGSSVYRSTDLGKTWDPAFNLGSGNSCFGLSAVPLPQLFQPNSVLVMHSVSTGVAGGCSNQVKGSAEEVTLVTFPAGTSVTLNFTSVSCAGGSGISSVFAVPRASAPPGATAAGVAFDVYAGNGWSFYVYNSPSSWLALRSGGARLHDDSWSMAFPIGYDPANVKCTAYAGTDGGVYKNTSSVVVSGGCDPSNGWVTAMHGLHSLETYVIDGVSQAVANPSCTECPDALYIATGDNDLWAVWNGGAKSGVEDFITGDAGEVHVDPAYPSQVINTRGLVATVASLPVGSGPPLPPNTTAGGAAPPSPQTPPAAGTGLASLPGVYYFTTGPCTGSVGNLGPCPLGPGNPTLTQLLAVAGETVTSPVYYAVVGGCTPGPNNTCPVLPDRIVSATGVPSAQAWKPVDGGPFFPAGSVLQIRASGGINNTLLWVLALASSGNGQVYQGRVVGGQVSKWNLVSGSGQTAIGNAADLFVDTYDSCNPNVLVYVCRAWVTDVKDSTIKMTTDGGNTWNASAAMATIATANGRYRFDCHHQNNANWFIFDYGCALSGMSFSRTDSNIGVAALYPGGVAYTNDGGQNWRELKGITTYLPTGSSSAQNLPGYPISVWYDENRAAGKPAIYVAFHWNRIVRVDGNFAVLPAQ
jgi:hypothetical protein